jgi:hypothetical protein
VKFSVALLPLLLPFFCIAQKKDSTYFYLNTHFQTAFISAQREPAVRFEGDHPWSLQMDMGVLKTNRRAWNYCNCFSQNGVSVSYTNFGNPANLGSAVAVTGFVEPYLVNANRFTLSLRASAGLVFLTKVYDSLTNRDNIFVSEPMSFFLSLGPAVSYRLNDRFSLKAAFVLNHISNGGRKNPNDGMNYFGYNFAVQYALRSYSLQRLPKQPFTDKNYRVVVHAFGVQRVAQATSVWAEESRALFGVNAGLIKRLGRMNGLGVGAEIYHDGIQSVFQQRYQRDMMTTISSVSVQHYLFFGKLLFGQQWGFYLSDNTGYRESYFQRYLLEYEFFKNWYAGFTLKSYNDRSDSFAFSTGYFFRL